MSRPDADAQVVAARDVEADEWTHGQRTFRQRRLGHAAGGETLGTSLYELDPGHRTWPAHFHTGNEEALYVLEGRLTLWLGHSEDRASRTLEPGDYVALPAGPEYTREVEATGGATAEFLVVSTMREPDVTVLPAARKAHIVAGDPPGEYENRYLSRTLDLDAAVPYWNDEDKVDDEGRDPLAECDGFDGEWPVVVAADLNWTEHDHEDGDRRFRRKQLGAAAGGEEIGTSLHEVNPGKRTWLAHYHTGNEEAMYVLDGEGTITLGEGRTDHPLEPGDYVALPRGESGYHEITAGESPLRFLAMATMNEPDITVYPEDGKVGLYAGSAPGGDRDERILSRYLDADAEVEYWVE